MRDANIEREAFREDEREPLGQEFCGMCLGMCFAAVMFTAGAVLATPIRVVSVWLDTGTAVEIVLVGVAALLAGGLVTGVSWRLLKR